MTIQEAKNQIHEEKVKYERKIQSIIYLFLRSKLAEKPILSFANYDEGADIYFCKCQLVEVGEESVVKVINPDGCELDGYQHNEIIKVPNDKVYQSIIIENKAICLF